VGKWLVGIVNPDFSISKFGLNILSNIPFVSQVFYNPFKCFLFTKNNVGMLPRQSCSKPPDLIRHRPEFLLVASPTPEVRTEPSSSFPRRRLQSRCRHCRTCSFLQDLYFHLKSDWKLKPFYRQITFLND
jgi:hypothetical protein